MNVVIVDNQVAAKIFNHSPVIRDDLGLVGLDGDGFHPSKDRMVLRRGLPISIMGARRFGSWMNIRARRCGPWMGTHVERLTFTRSIRLEDAKANLKMVEACYKLSKSAGFSSADFVRNDIDEITDFRGTCYRPRCIANTRVQTLCSPMKGALERSYCACTHVTVTF